MDDLDSSTNVVNAKNVGPIANTSGDSPSSSPAAVGGSLNAGQLTDESLPTWSEEDRSSADREALGEANERQVTAQVFREADARVQDDPVGSDSLRRRDVNLSVEELDDLRDNIVI